jgi:hypothetical protein
LIIIASDENDAIQMCNHALLMRSITESRPCSARQLAQPSVRRQSRKADAAAVISTLAKGVLG